MSVFSRQRSFSASNHTKSSLSAMVIFTITLFQALAPLVLARSMIRTGDSLSSNEYLVSLNKRNYFRMQTDGNAVVFNESNLSIWNSDSMGPEGIHRLTLKSDGQVVISHPSGAEQTMFDVRSDWPKGTWSLELYNNGYLYLMDPRGNFRWTSLCYIYGTSLKSGDRMKDSCLISPTFNSFLKIDSNGQLTTRTGSDIRFTSPEGGRYLELTDKAELRILNSDGGVRAVLFDGVSTHGTYFAAVTDNADFIIRDSNGKEIWATQFVDNREPSDRRLDLEQTRFSVV